MKIRKNALATVAGLIAAITLPLAVSADSASLTIQSLSPSSTIKVGNELTFNVMPDAFSGAVTYSVSDSMSGSSVTNANLNASGVFTWIPTQADSGSHTITITGTDGIATTNVSQNIVVIGTPAIAINSVSASSTAPGTAITFTALATSFQAIPVYSISDTANNSTLVSGNINSSTGAFSWTPNVSDVGQHNITVLAHDSDGDSASTMVTLFVQGSAKFTLTSPSPGYTVSVGTSVSFNSVTSNFSPIHFTASDSFASSTVNNNNISQSGYFVWTPVAGDVGTHTITVTVGDYNNSSASYSTTTTLTVNTAPYVAPTPTITAPTTTVSMPATPVTPAYVFSIYLKLGSKGTDVSELQKILIRKGFLSGDPTGFFGSLTQSAVIKYQKAQGIAALGVVGPSTRTALNAETSTSVTSPNTALIAALMQEVQVLLAKIAAIKAGQQ